MLRVLLCDDDALFLNRVKSRVEAFLSSQGERFEILAHTDTSLISDRELTLCDLALLDVDLATPEDDGIALARRLRAFRQDAVLIFVTNYVEFAPAGYEVSAFRYVLKRDLEGIFNTYLSQALDRIRLAREVYPIWVDGKQVELPIKYLERLEIMGPPAPINIFRLEKCFGEKPARLSLHFVAFSQLCRKISTCAKPLESQ